MVDSLFNYRANFQRINCVVFLCIGPDSEGHTSGHLSLYLPSVKSVITGDAAVKEENELVIANPPFCLDIEKAEQSLTKKWFNR